MRNLIISILLLILVLPINTTLDAPCDDAAKGHGPCDAKNHESCGLANKMLDPRNKDNHKLCECDYLELHYVTYPIKLMKDPKGERCRRPVGSPCTDQQPKEEIDKEEHEECITRFCDKETDQCSYAVKRNGGVSKHLFGIWSLVVILSFVLL